jgi:hypothetical protein
MLLIPGAVPWALEDDPVHRGRWRMILFTGPEGIEFVNATDDPHKK